MHECGFSSGMIGPGVEMLAFLGEFDSSLPLHVGVQESRKTCTYHRASGSVPRLRRNTKYRCDMHISTLLQGSPTCAYAILNRPVTLVRRVARNSRERETWANSA